MGSPGQEPPSSNGACEGDALEPTADLPDGERCFRMAFQTAAVGMAIVSLDGRFLVTNQRLTEILGYPRGGLDGKAARGVTHTDDIAASVEAYRALYAGTIPSVRMEKRLHHHDGGVIWVQITASVIRSENGKPLYCFHQIEDISEQKKLRAELRQQERLASVGALAAGVAHEINNPLTYVSLGVQGIAEGLISTRQRADDGAATLLSLIDDVLDGTRRIQRIVRDLKTFSRVEEERTDHVNVNEILRVALGLADHETKYRATVVAEYGDLPPVRASEGRLCQVFVNLIVNAAQAMDTAQFRDNQLTVRSSLEGSDVCVEIADTGKGIAPEHLAHIFDPFFSTKPLGVGSGLGLSICHSIIKAHGGRIEVESTVGQGTRFLVWFPVAAP